MISANDLNRLIMIERPTKADNGLTTAITGWDPIFPMWAQRKDVSDAEKFNAQQVGRNLTTRFRVRNNADSRTVTTEDRISCEGVVYQIIGIKESDDETLEFTAVSAP